ncbi:hypothetical protein PVAND_002461 [Polypedilum vanderplanki]|uniref:Uncharacterized protein n=1 Tax=Polypedilum vanderplanki TaxID=319348 RepID=A0A9J6BR99_POLVA|nr:hypothetical protein PVAND_002461 [Polypedilum vanderplanki]
MKSILFFITLCILTTYCNIIRNKTLKVCETDACYAARDRILTFMDSSIDPCDDFYKYSCGNYIKTKRIPDFLPIIFPFKELQMKVDEQIVKILEEPIIGNEIKLFKDVKKFYQSCTNTETIKNLGISPLMNKIEELDGWPVLGDGKWNEANWSWQKVSKKLFQNGFSSNFIFSLFVDTDYKNTSMRNAKIAAADLALNREYFMRKDERYYAYKEFQIDLVLMLSSNLSRTEIESKMSKVLEFEEFLASISKNRFSNLVTIRKLQQNFPFNNWLIFLNSLMPNETQFTLDDVIDDCQYNFLNRLGVKLRKTSKEVLANYMMWRVAFNSASFLNQSIKNRFSKFISTFTGQKNQRSRETFCAVITSEFFPHAISALYVRRYFKESVKEKIQEMVNYMKIVFKENLKTINWMNEVTKKQVIVKLNTLYALIGPAQELYNDTELENFYKNFNVEIDSENFFETMLNVKTATNNFGLNKLRQKVKKNDWIENKASFIANAFIHHGKNRFEILAAILNDPIYNENLPEYMNFGAIGSVIGHELTHAFDNAGSLFDENGNFREWWSLESRRNFMNLNECFIAQYNNFTEPVTGLNLNGKRTQSENIADTNGIKFAYKSYKKWVEEHGDEELLLDIELNQKQLFWISAAQSRCSVARKEFLEDSILVKKHVPHQFRIIGSFGNQEDFSRDFNCLSESYMNFKNKCSVW